MFTRNRVIMSHNIKTPLTSISRAVGNILQLKYDQLIQSLFANNEQGFFYDPNDLSTMFQNSAGTIPVTAVGQPVGLIRDKSGRNNHAYQATSASRPILRKNAVTGANYLEFDGTDDFLQTGNIDFTATDKVSLFAGVRKLSDAAIRILAELSTNSDSTSGTFALAASVGGNNYFTQSRGTVRSFKDATGYVAPNSAVLVAEAKISTDTLRLHVNNAAPLSSATDQGTGNYGNYPLYIGRRGGVAYPFNGHIYGLIGIGKLTSDAETLAIEKELAKRTGVTL